MTLNFGNLSMGTPDEIKTSTFEENNVELYASYRVAPNARKVFFPNQPVFENASQKVNYLLANEELNVAVNKVEALKYGFSNEVSKNPFSYLHDFFTQEKLQNLRGKVIGIANECNLSVIDVAKGCMLVVGFEWSHFCGAIFFDYKEET